MKSTNSESSTSMVFVPMKFGFTGVKLFFETDEEKEIRLKKEQQEKENEELEANRKKEEFERGLLRQLKEKYELQ